MARGGWAGDLGRPPDRTEGRELRLPESADVRRTGLPAIWRATHFPRLRSGAHNVMHGPSRGLVWLESRSNIMRHFNQPV